MKKLLLAIAMLMLVCTTNAFAIPVEFLISDLFDWGRLYNYSDPDGLGGAPGTWTTSNSNPYVPAGGWVDTPVGRVITENTFGNADTNGVLIPPKWGEDSWGVAQIDQIQTLPGPGTLLFDKDIPGSGELTIFFWGFDDDFLSMPVAGTSTILSKGGHAEVWFDPTPNYAPGQGTAGRSNTADPSFYNSVTDDGTLVLDLVPVDQTGSGHTFLSTFNFGSLTGGGTIYFGVSGLGAWDSLYDTNTQLFGSDFLFQNTSEPDPNGQTSGWIVRGAGRAVGNVIPEPTSLALLGLGLVGVARLRRKRA